MLQRIIENALIKVLNIKDEKLSILKHISETKTELLNTQKKLSETKIELNEVRAEKERENTEIKHMVQMVKEKNDIKLEKAEQKIIGEYQKKELALTQKFQDDLNKILEGNLKVQKSMYDKISDTLASAVSVEISK